MKQAQSSIWNSNHTFAGKLLRLPFRLVPHEAKIRVLSGINKGALWEVGAGVHQCWLGSYEREKQEAISQAVHLGMVVWDVGANVGFYTLAFSKLAGPSGEVVAFEPDGLNAAYLLQHVTLNSCANVTVVQAAVADSVAMVSFSVGEGSFMGAIKEQSAYKIPCINLDGFAKEGKHRMPDLIKIDVEGAEASVLRGATSLLSEHAPELWLALHNKNAMRDCTELLNSCGYSIFDFSGSRLNTIEVEEVVARKTDCSAAPRALHSGLDRHS